MPFTHKAITGKDYYLLRDSICPGTLLFTTKYGEFSNIINKSNPKHGAIYVGDIHGDGIRYVVEAIGKGVVLTDLVSFLLTKDELVIVEPTFTDKEGMREAAKEAIKLIGSEYDLDFDLKNKKYYCIEAQVVAYKKIFPNLEVSFEEAFGIKAYIAQNIIEDTKNWRTVFDNRKE